MASVTFRDVSRIYDGNAAVDRLSLKVEDGEFLVLVGPSGCGKSTTLRMLAGLEDVSSGNISIGDRRVDRIAARDRDIAMVFQSYALYPHMTVFDNMAFALKIRKFSDEEISKRVNEAANILGIHNLLKRKPGQLSGGQRQRVALGRAIVRSPAVFLLDEPLSNLDASLRVATRAELSKLHQRLGATFIYVTHDQVEAMTMATRIAVMSKGALQQVGTPTELYDHPQNQFVAGFIGSPSMNFIEMEVDSANGGTVLTAQGLKLPLEAGSDHARAVAGRTKVTVGIRPEHIHDPQFIPNRSQTASFTATIDLEERLGNETFLHAKVGSTTLLARVNPQSSASVGSQYRLELEYLRIHLFDPASGERLEPQEVKGQRDPGYANVTAAAES
ncbi:MAG: ABC transporter ATP-binding protein [Dehalococcoidia bacterium]